MQQTIIESTYDYPGVEILQETIKSQEELDAEYLAWYLQNN